MAEEEEEIEYEVEKILERDGDDFKVRWVGFSKKFEFIAKKA